MTTPITDFPEQEETSTKSNSVFLSRLNEALESRFNDLDLCSGNLHRLIPTSRATLHRRLNQETGLCASAYLNMFRVYRSLDFFAQTKLSISDIAFMVGMNCSAYSRAFKMFLGQCPNEFRASGANTTQSCLVDANVGIFETIGKSV